MIEAENLPQSQPPFTLRAYRKGDEIQILELFRDVFESERSLAHWEWQFQKNPFDIPRATLVYDPISQKLIGQYTVVPIGINMMGRQIKGALSVDTMVHPAFRLHGIFEASAHECYQRLAHDGYSLVCGFPNRNSFPGFVKKLDWTRVAFLTVYYMRLSITQELEDGLAIPGLAWLANLLFQQFVKARLKLTIFVLARTRKNVVFRASERVPSMYQELWDAVRSYEILCVWKDARYFAWRYDQNPQNSFKYYYVERDGKIEALCVTIAKNGTLHILELVVRNHDAGMAKYLVTLTANQACCDGIRRVNFCGSSLRFFDIVFQEFKRAYDLSFVFCVGVLGNAIPTRVADSSSNWTVTQGDTDAF